MRVGFSKAFLHGGRRGFTQQAEHHDADAAEDAETPEPPEIAIARPDAAQPAVQPGIAAPAIQPGGISVTEAASMRLPMVFIDAVAGCEEYNKDFFLRTGGAVTGQTPKEIARTSLRLLSDEHTLEKMGDALDAAVPHNAAANILSEMSEAEEEKEEDLA